MATKLPPVPQLTAQGFDDPVWARWLDVLRQNIVANTVASIVTASAPLSASGSPANISISQAGAGSAGFLSIADWGTFNGKQSALGFTPAPIASPTFTGVPAAPTAAVDVGTTQVATTGFVLGQASSLVPLINGAGAVGTSLRYTRQDHVHPTDTSRQAAFTGLTATIATAKLTAGGANGSMTFTNGVLTAQTAAT